MFIIFTIFTITQENIYCQDSKDNNDDIIQNKSIESNDISKNIENVLQCYQENASNGKER